MLVVDYYTLHTLKRDIDDVLYLIKTLISRCLPTSLLQVETKVVNAPLRPVLGIVIIRCFLNSNIG